jgi:hypothetical protein
MVFVILFIKYHSLHLLMNSKGNHNVAEFLIQMAENPAIFEEYKIDPNRVLSTFDLPDDIKSDIVSGKLENIRRDIKRNKKPSHPGGGGGYALDPDY